MLHINKVLFQVCRNAYGCWVDAKPDKILDKYLGLKKPSLSLNIFKAEYSSKQKILQAE